MDFGLVPWQNSNLVMDLVLVLKYINENKIERFCFIWNEVMNYGNN